MLTSQPNAAPDGAERPIAASAGRRVMHGVNPIGRHAQAEPRPRGLARWVVGAVAGTAVLSFLVAAAALSWQALHERHDLLHRGLTASAMAVALIERETQALGNTLRGLSRS